MRDLSQDSVRKVIAVFQEIGFELQEGLIGDAAFWEVCRRVAEAYDSRLGFEEQFKVEEVLYQIGLLRTVPELLRWVADRGQKGLTSDFPGFDLFEPVAEPLGPAMAIAPDTGAYRLPEVD